MKPVQQNEMNDKNQNDNDDVFVSPVQVCRQSFWVAWKVSIHFLKMRIHKFNFVDTVNAKMLILDDSLYKYRIKAQWRTKREPRCLHSLNYVRFNHRGAKMHRHFVFLLCKVVILLKTPWNAIYPTTRPRQPVHNKYQNGQKQFIFVPAIKEYDDLVKSVLFI